MLNDRNKTALTKQITSAATIYLDERGCKPIETEVTVDQGWVADIASVVTPTFTELIALKLIGRAPRWGDSRLEEWIERAKTFTNAMTVLVEVKASRGDFLSDRKWQLPLPVDLAYVAIPKELTVLASELPAGWGVLAIHGDCLRLERKPEPQSVSYEQQLSVVLQVAIRRDHNTRYQRLRELRREQLDERGAQRSVTRTMDAFRAMQSVVLGNHESVAGALAFHGVKSIPKYYLPELEKLWAVAKQETPGIRMEVNRGEVSCQ